MGLEIVHVQRHAVAGPTLEGLDLWGSVKDSG